MKKVVRAEHITIVYYKGIDLIKETIITDTIVLPHWYTSNKIMITKLETLLTEQNIRLIEVTKKEKYTRYYTQTLKFFKENAEHIKDVYQQEKKKEKE